jgi:hypothetical protein
MAVADDLQVEVAGAVRKTSPLADAPVGTLALCDAGDPFAAAMQDTLLGLGFRLDATAATRLLLGSDAARCRQEARRGAGLVAVGDAAAQVLGDAGFALRSIRPEHGRIVRCLPVETAPWHAERAFFAARYATLAIDWPTHLLPPGSDSRSPGSADAASWSTWLRDEQGSPLIVAHAGRRVVCLLIRPESLLSDDLARGALRAAIVFAGGTAQGRDAGGLP